MQQNDRARNPSPYFRPVQWLGMTVVMLLISWLLSLAVELIGIALDLWGWDHAATLLLYELHLLSQQQVTWMGTSPYQLAAQWLSMIEQFSVPDAFGVVQPILTVCIQMLQLTILRLVIALFSLPLIAIFAIVALVDGLVERDLRRFDAANESAWIYHWSKRLTKPWMVAPVFLYLSMPVSVHPNLIFLPAALVFAAGLRTTTAYLKKVL